MTPLQALRNAGELTQRIIEAEPLESLFDQPTPCAEFDVRALLDHIVDTHTFLITAAGGSFDPSGDIARRHREAVESALATWNARGDDGTIELGGNDLPAPFVQSLHALEAIVHAWDLAVATGRSFEPDPDLIAAGWDAARMIVSDPARGTEPGSPYGPEVAAEADWTDLDRLVAFCGRHPHFATVESS